MYIFNEETDCLHWQLINRYPLVALDRFRIWQQSAGTICKIKSHEWLSVFLGWYTVHMTNHTHNNYTSLLVKFDFEENFIVVTPYFLLIYWWSILYWKSSHHLSCMVTELHLCACDKVVSFCSFKKQIIFHQASI